MTIDRAPTYSSETVKRILEDDSLDLETKARRLLDLRRHMDHLCFHLVVDLQHGGSLPLDGSDEEIIQTRIEADDALLYLISQPNQATNQEES